MDSEPTTINIGERESDPLLDIDKCYKCGSWIINECCVLDDFGVQCHICWNKEMNEEAEPVVYCKRQRNSESWTLIDYCLEASP